MKKAISVVMLLVFAASFVTGLIVSEATASPGCDPPVCIDGKVWQCCWEYIGNGQLVEKCHWDGPC